MPSGSKYRDSPDVARLFRCARATGSKEDWKAALRGRLRAREVWASEKLVSAVQGDWKAYRSLKPRAKGWEPGFVDAVAPADPHETVHAHFRTIFQGAGRQVRPIDPIDPVTPVPDFTHEELLQAVRQGKNGKSAGPDQVPHELLVALAEDEVSGLALLRWMNAILHSGDLPAEWERVVMVLLPKLPAPKVPGDLRPISLSCSSSKLFSRMLLGRTQEAILTGYPGQCAGVHKQASDYVFSLYRMLELCREWRRPGYFLKLDVSKAFDKLSRPALLERLLTKLGYNEVYRAWHNALATTVRIVQSPWGSTELDIWSGIRQGAVESPAFFAAVADWSMLDVVQELGLENTSFLFHELPLVGVSFMDDSILWEATRALIQGLADAVVHSLSRWGLSINVAKSQLYVTPDARDKGPILVAGQVLQPSDYLLVMGLKFAVGASVVDLVGPLLARARDVFWGLKHLFLGKAPLKGKLNLLYKVVLGSFAWCIGAIPPDNAALHAVNSYLYQMVAWCMGLRRRPGEGWLEHRVRSLRAARNMVHRLVGKRWSIRFGWRGSGHTRVIVQGFPRALWHRRSFVTFEQGPGGPTSRGR